MDFTDYDASVFIITKGGEMIWGKEVGKEYSRKAQFLMLTNDILNQDYKPDHSIYVSVDCVRQSERIYDKRSGGVRWFDSQDAFPGTRCVSYDGKDPERLFGIDFDGYLNTMDIIENCPRVTDGITHTRIGDDGTADEYSVYLTREDTIPAVMDAYNTCVWHRGRHVHGYLPAVSELLVFGINVLRVDEVLMAMGKGRFHIQMGRAKSNGRIVGRILGAFWTSTMNGHDSAFVVNTGNAYYVSLDHTEFDYTRPIKVLPFFKIDV